MVDIDEEFIDVGFLIEIMVAIVVGVNLFPSITPGESEREKLLRDLRKMIGLPEVIED
jgi:hypothetical protein